jgi:hypothetical protein
VFSKTLALAVVTSLLDRSLRFLGPVRLVPDSIAYASLASALRVFTIQDIGHLVRLIRHRWGSDGATPDSSRARAERVIATRLSATQLSRVERGLDRRVGIASPRSRSAL